MGHGCAEAPLAMVARVLRQNVPFPEPNVAASHPCRDRSGVPKQMMASRPSGNSFAWLRLQVSSVMSVCCLWPDQGIPLEPCWPGSARENAGRHAVESEATGHEGHPSNGPPIRLDGIPQTDTARIQIDLDGSGLPGFGVEPRYGKTAAGNQQGVAGSASWKGRYRADRYPRGQGDGRPARRLCPTAVSRSVQPAFRPAVRSHFWHPDSHGRRE